MPNLRKYVNMHRCMQAFICSLYKETTGFKSKLNGIWISDIFLYGQYTAVATYNILPGSTYLTCDNYVMVKNCNCVL